MSREKFLQSVISLAIRGQKCPICLENLSDRRAAVLTVCTHAYCLECISKWSNLKRNCPLCNAPFYSWFYKINLSSLKFLRQQLLSLTKEKTANSQSHFSSRAPQRVMRKSREEFNSERWRSMPLPWRRAFGRAGLVPGNVWPKGNFGSEPVFITNACKLFLYLLGVVLHRMHQVIIM